MNLPTAPGGFEVDVMELEVEVPPGKLLTYDLRSLASSLYILDTACMAVETDGLTRALVTVYAAPPLDKLDPVRGEDLVMDDQGWLTVGRYHDGQPAQIRLYVPGSGAQRGALFGTTGAGKSRALQLILAAEKRSGIATWLADLKAGQSVPEAAGQVDWRVTTQEGLLAMLQAAVRVAEERMSRYAAMGRSSFLINRPDPLLSVRIDEANRALEKGAPYRDKVAALIKELGRTGRSVGVGISIAAQASHVDELGGSDTLRGMLKEGDTILLRWSSSMMQSLVSDGLLPPGTHIVPIPKRTGPPVLRSRFATVRPRAKVPRGTTGGMAYLLGSDRPTAMMRFFPVGSMHEVEGLDPLILDLYGPGEPAHLEVTSHEAAGPAYLTRDGDGPAELVAAAQEQTQALVEEAAAEQKTSTSGRAPIAVRIMRALEEAAEAADGDDTEGAGALDFDEILAAVNADGGKPVGAASVRNNLSVLSRGDRIAALGGGRYTLPA
ncbi:transfer protein [Kitasatospora sp. NPDC059327]|uniref:transfer protein n=1 Tax=Kitasatospora sp. NPDC059327 TaxID=3346803 RepID=UPI00369CC8AA